MERPKREAVATVGGQRPSLAVPAEGRQTESTAPPDGRAQVAEVSRGAGSAVELYRLRGARASRQVDLTATYCWSLVEKLTVKE